MEDVNWVLCDFGGREEERRWGWGVIPVLGHLCPKNWDPREKLPFELQSTAYYKPSLAISLIVS